MFSLLTNMDNTTKAYDLLQYFPTIVFIMVFLLNSSRVIDAK